MKLFTQQEGKNFPESLSFIVLLALLFLLPIFVSPVGLLSFAFAKVFLTVLAVVITFSLFILSVLKKGSVTFSKNWTMLTLLVVPLVVLISALFSASRVTSLIGYGIEPDTFFLVLILFVLMFLVTQTFTSAKKIFYAYLAFALAALILFVFHGVRFLAGPDFLSFNNFSLITSNTFGKWNDLAILSGIIVILSTLLLETTRVNKQMKIAAYTMFALGLVFLAIVNFFLVWAVIGVFSLISFVYLFSFGNKEGKERKVPVLSIIVLVCSALFLIAGGQIGQTVASILGINIVDVRPLWSSTLEVAQNTFTGIKNILLGSGPNTFSAQWDKFKPDAVNQGVLWNTDFSFGISYLATTLITTGVLGVLAWISFLVFFVYQGFSSLFVKNTQGSFLSYLSLSSFITALFLWVMLFLYVPGIVVIILTFFFTGLFFATLSVSGVLPQKEISFTKTPKIGFVITLALVFVLIAGISLGYLSFQKTLSSVYYQRGLLALNQNEPDIATAGQYISRAVALSGHDVYYRTLVDLNLFQLNQILSTEDLSSSVSVGRAQQALGLAVANAQAAVVARPLSYQNYAILGGVYAAVAPLNVEGAIAGAQSAYEAAMVHAPKNPSLPLAIARLEANNGNVDGARENIREALALKNNYTEAIFTLAQIEVAEGNIDQAISSVEVATLIEPNNASLYFQLGLLYYNKEDFKDAATAFENATALVTQYANAKYFLGLSYYELSRRSDAINEFIDLQATNPENEEIQFILDNLQAGLSPFNEVQAPLDDKPEDREELPLEEDNL